MMDNCACTTSGAALPVFPSENMIGTVYIRFIKGGILMVFLVVALAGCSRSPRVTFYTLESGAQVGVSAAATTVPTIAVGPVTLPEVADRPQFVVRVAANRVDILETHRWAEPLKSEIPRLIAENMNRLLGSSQVSSTLQHASAHAEYRVLVDIRRFEASPGKEVIVEAVWSVRRAGGDASKTGRTLVREPAAGEGYDHLVAAYGRALLAVSSDLTGAVRAAEGR